MKTCRYHIKMFENEMQNSLEKKKTRTNFAPKRHYVKFAKNFDLNRMSACVHENL